MKQKRFNPKKNKGARRQRPTEVTRIIGGQHAVGYLDANGRFIFKYWMHPDIVDRASGVKSKYDGSGKLKHVAIVDVPEEANSDEA